MRPSRPLLHGAAAGAQLPLTNRAAAAQPQRHWHSHQQLPAVVAAGGAADGIGSAGAPRVKQNGVQAKWSCRGSRRQSDRIRSMLKRRGETKRKRASESNIFEEKRMVAALSPVELQQHRSCAARLALHCRSRTGRPSRHARRRRATKALARRAASVRLLASTAAANGGENRATLAGAASTRPSKSRRGTPTRPSKGGRGTERWKQKAFRKQKATNLHWLRPHGRYRPC